MFTFSNVHLLPVIIYIYILYSTTFLSPPSLILTHPPFLFLPLVSFISPPPLCCLQRDSIFTYQKSSNGVWEKYVNRQPLN